MTDDQERRDEAALRELREKARVASERALKDKATSRSGDFDPLATVESVERDVTCGTCEKTFRASGTKFGSKMLLPTRCDECVREEDTVAVGSIDVFGELERIGFNVRRHGRVKLEDFTGFTFNVGGVPEPLEPVVRKYAEHVRLLKRWQEIGSLYVFGPTGTGKTQLQVAMARELLENGYPPTSIVFVRARALISRIQDTYGSGKVDATIDKLRNAGTLFVDDAGTEKITADAFRIVEDILDAREGHPTVWSSNVAPDELVNQWADGTDAQTFRFRSRLNGFRFIPLEGPDRRFES